MLWRRPYSGGDFEECGIERRRGQSRYLHRDGGDHTTVLREGGDGVGQRVPGIRRGSLQGAGWEVLQLDVPAVGFGALFGGGIGFGHLQPAGGIAEHLLVLTGVDHGDLSRGLRCRGRFGGLAHESLGIVVDLNDSFEVALAQQAFALAIVVAEAFASRIDDGLGGLAVGHIFGGDFGIGQCRGRGA